MADRYDTIYRGFAGTCPRLQPGRGVLRALARDTPDAVAIRCEQENGTRLRVSYGQLHRQASRAANSLARARRAAWRPRGHRAAAAHRHRGGAMAVY
jgi:acyl-CoA synthetase (AMP-forming)/AMP-acid ligase II